MSILGGFLLFLAVMVAWIAAGWYLSLLLGLIIRAANAPINNPEYRNTRNTHNNNTHIHTRRY